MPVKIGGGTENRILLKLRRRTVGKQTLPRRGERSNKEGMWQHKAKAIREVLRGERQVRCRE